MAKKTWIVATFTGLLLAFSSTLGAQTVTQMGFIIKKALPETGVIAILVHQMQKERLIKEAQSAQLITKVKYSVNTVSNKSEIATKISNIKNLDNSVTLIITDELILTESTVKFIAQKLASQGIPVISNRAKDTLQGILLTISLNDSALEKHVNKISMSALGISLSDDFLTECVIDVE